MMNSPAKAPAITGTAGCLQLIHEEPIARISRWYPNPAPAPQIMATVVLRIMGRVYRRASPGYRSHQSYMSYTPP